MATINKQKVCDKCGDLVAEKSLLWHTFKDYVTVRLDEVPGYGNYEENTVVRKLHYCFSCWVGIAHQAKQEDKPCD